MKAVCLISGGLDSAVSAAIAKSEGNDIYALTVDYGQRHAREIDSAKKIAKFLGAKEHKTVKADLRQIGGSALTSEMKVPERTESEIDNSEDIPVTYVPARNTILLSIALAYAEVVGADSIFIGANAVDYSGYVDCRPEFIEEFQKLANLATKRTVEGNKISIRAPLIEMPKAEIIQKGTSLGVPFRDTWSCYKGKEKACGVCDSCVIRLAGFKAAGLKDPIDYER
jgi:7-cyano-7-deazaguanine synthase